MTLGLLGPEHMAQPVPTAVANFAGEARPHGFAFDSEFDLEESSDEDSSDEDGPFWYRASGRTDSWSWARDGWSWRW